MNTSAETSSPDRDRPAEHSSSTDSASTDSTGDVLPVIAYDEFSLFEENIAEFELDVGPVPSVRREHVVVAPTGAGDDGARDDSGGRAVSVLVWGDGPAEVVFVHGGAQNAHTWDTVALALGRSAIAVDLPGHGHSSWRTDGAYSPANLADDIARAIETHAPEAQLVVGMSLGGLTSMMLATRHPDLVRRLMMVDITPGVNGEKAKAIIDFVNGPQSFTSFDDLLARTLEFNPTRSVSSLRRGILHNAHQLADGSWQWNYDRTNRHGQDDAGRADADPANAATGSAMPESGVVASGSEVNPLWQDFAAVACPLTLVRGSLSPVVDDADVAEAVRLQPELTVHMVDGAGHSVQGDRPVELAELIARELD